MSTEQHPHAIGRRINAGLTLVGAAAAAVLALAGGSPAANGRPDLPGNTRHLRFT